ncbi:MAG TPA: energy transducer TonB [Chitinophagaceae bacterium]|nr:energy transducer TonB [Chitinophagaceae bacterium]
MDTNQILQSDMLDLVFDGRNKNYGAYVLRRNYNRHMMIGLVITTGTALFIFLSSFLLPPAGKKQNFKVNVVELIDLPPDQVLPPEEKPKPTVQQDLRTEPYTTPRIEQDASVQPEDIQPELNDLDGAMIGTEHKDGSEYGGEAVAPAESGAGAIEAPKPVDDGNVIIERVDIDAEFPGGNQAWTRYVSREIERNMDELEEEGRSGSVVVIFVVDKEGLVSDVRVLPCEISGIANCLDNSSTLAEVAVKAIKKGPKWKPAMQNGRVVKSYRRQPVTFRLDNN